MSSPPMNYPVGSAIPQALVNFMALATQTLPAGTTVYFGAELAAWSAPLTLQILEITGDQNPAEIGPRYRREETFSMTCQLSVYQGGGPQETAFPTLLQTVMGYFNQLALAVGNNPTLYQDGDTAQAVRYAEVGNFIITPAVDTNGMSAVTLAFAVRCQQRVESISGD